MKWHSLGERLSGHALRHSGHDLTFGAKKEEACTAPPLTKQQAQQFQKAIQHRWFYQMYLDDLPVWGMVGEMLQSPLALPAGSKEKDDLARLDHAADIPDEALTRDLSPYIYTTRNLVISYNRDRIVKVDLTSDPKSLVLVKEGAKLTFTLKVSVAVVFVFGVSTIFGGWVGKWCEGCRAWRRSSSGRRSDK